MQIVSTREQIPDRKTERERERKREQVEEVYCLLATFNSIS